MNSIEFKDLEFYHKIGQGSFGKVWEGSYLGTPVAIKECLPTEDETHFDFLKYFEREADLLSESRHPNIVQFLGTCVHDSKFYIVTEYVSGGTMKSWIISGKADEIKIRLSFAIDIARALTYLHTRNIMHRDLKPSNLLITENKRIKVCDFGFARLFALSEDERRRMTVCGTDEYMAPELLQGKAFNELADVFGFGIILCELISLKMASLHAFKRSAPDFKIHATEVQDRATQDCPRDLVALTIKCISQDPVERPTMREVLCELCAIENSFKPVPSIQIGFLRESHNNPKYLPTALSTSLNPDTNISKPVPGPDYIMPYTPNLVCDLSIHSSDLSPYSNCSNTCTRDPSTLSRTDDSIQEVLNASSDAAKDLPQTAPEISILHKSPFQNFFIGEASIQLGQMAVPQIDGSQGTAKFAFQELSKLNHEGIELNIPRQLSSVAITGRGHRFSIQRVDALETCSFCQQRLSDFLDSTYGMVCDDCSFLCHKRCSTLAPYNCDAPSPAHRALTSLFSPLASIE